MEPTLKFPELAHVFLLWKQQYGCHQGFHLTFFQLPPRVLSPGVSSVASIGHLLHWRPMNSDHVYFSATACSSTDLAMTGKTDFNVAVCHRSKTYRASHFILFQVHSVMFLSTMSLLVMNEQTAQAPLITSK